MRIRLTAPEGYKYLDKMTGRTHSELVIDVRHKKRYELVADNSEPITEV